MRNINTSFQLHHHT
ncbi:Protein of unknown function [Bacillus cereus]|nr:Protein of unknown function [Bacillus mobilis]SCN33410.1 Protein of unknown function [Bacillus cereus]